MSCPATSMFFSHSASLTSPWLLRCLQPFILLSIFSALYSLCVFLLLQVSLEIILSFPPPF